MNQINLINGWSAGETPDGYREWSVALHFQPSYKGERTFLPNSTEGLLVGVEIDNPSSKLHWKDLVSISDLLSQSPSGYTVDPAFGLIYIKYVGDSVPESPFVMMNNPMSVGMVTQARADALQEKASSVYSPKRWWLWLVVLALFVFCLVVWFFELRKSKNVQGSFLKKYKFSFSSLGVLIVATIVITIVAYK